MIRFLLVCLILTPLGALALDEAELAKRLQEFRAWAAGRHAQLGAWCFDQKLFAEGTSDLQKALQLDPDHKEARRRLGYTRKETGWIVNPKKNPPKENKAPSARLPALLEQAKSKRASLHQEAAQKLYEIGAWCDKNGDKEKAKEFYKEAIGTHGDHAKAREALGYRREGQNWVAPEDRAAEQEIAQEKQKADEGQPVEEASEVESLLAIKMSKRQSEHFLLESFYDHEKTKELVKIAETAWHEYHRQMEVTPEETIGTSRIHGIILDTKSQHEFYVDRVMTGEGKGWMKSFAGFHEYSPPMFEGYRVDGSDHYPKDFTVHDTVHILFYFQIESGYENVKPWLYEAMAYYFTLQIASSAETSCANLETGGAGGGHGGTLSEWKGNMRYRVDNGKDDDIHKVLRVSLNAHDSGTMAKAWSLVDFLMTKEKPRFFAFLDALRRGLEQDKALLDGLGWTAGELDGHWKDYVRKNY